MILSQRQLEEIAASTTKDFNRFFFGDEADKPDRSALPTPIDQFAKNYLGLRVSFARLSPDGSICGVTAYADTEYKITELGITRTLALKRNQIILDESFIRSGNVQRLCAKRRFTLAHECAHQILFQLESEEVKTSCEMKYSARTAYTPRELKTREDWNEWQANVLGAAILLPQKEVDLAMRRFAETPLINYEGRYSYGDHLTLRLFCRLFGVSKTTASIRLRQLGYMVDRPFSEYVIYTIKQMANDLDRSERTVKTALRELENAGLITRVRQGWNQANRIFLQIPDRVQVSSRPEGNICPMDVQDSSPCMEQNLPASNTDTEYKEHSKNERVESTRRRYGEFQNVFLSGEECSRLETAYPGKAAEYIERLSRYMASNDRHYANHYATVKKWLDEDSKGRSAKNYTYDDNEGECL